MRARGFPPIAREPAVEIASGKVIHPDLGLPADGFYVEVDHHTWHGGRAASTYDRWRDRQRRLQGLHVERVTDQAIDNDLAAPVDDLWHLWQLHRDRSATFGVAERSR